MRQNGQLVLSRFTLGVIAASCLLLAQAVGLAFLLPANEPRRPADAASPEATVYAWVEAHRAGDIARAHALLSRVAQEDEPFDTYRVRRADAFGPANDRRRVLVSLLDAGPTEARIQILVERFHVEVRPFPAGPEHRVSTVDLVREYGAWRIDQIDEWPSFDGPRLRRV